MHQLVQEYLDKKANESAELALKEKNELLLELDLCEKEYTDKKEYSEEYPCWDNQILRYYRKNPVEISDSEYAEILKYQKNKAAEAHETDTNKVANIFKVFAWIVFIGGFIAGIALGRDFRGDFSFGLAIVYWVAFFVAGMLYYGFAEIIQLLADIRNK